MERYVAYCRRSTETEQQRKWSTSTQYEEIESFAKERSIPIIARFDEAQSGTDKDRPKLLEAIALCEAENATLIVSKLSRLSRNIGQVEELYNSSLKIVIVEFGIEVSYEQILMFAMVNSIQVQILKRNVKRGIAHARSRGVVWNKLTSEQRKMGTRQSSINASKTRSRIGPILNGLRIQGYTYKEIASIMNQNGQLSSRGKKYTHMTVYRTLKSWRQDEEENRANQAMELCFEPMGNKG